MDREKLKVGLLLDGHIVDAWLYKMIDIIDKSHYADLKSVILYDDSVHANNKPVKKSVISRYKDRLSLMPRVFIDAVYNYLIEKNNDIPDAKENRDLEPLLTGLFTIKAEMPHDGTSTNESHCNDDKPAAIHDIDILIDCANACVSSDIIRIARYGVWSVVHGDNRINSGGPEGFWATMEDRPTTSSAVRIRIGDEDFILARSFACTHPLSVRANRSRYLWKSLLFIPRAMEQLYDLGSEKFFARVKAENMYPSLYSGKVYSNPRNAKLAWLVARKIYQRIMLSLYSKIFFNQWILMFSIQDRFASTLCHYQKIIPPKDRAWADPHIVYNNNKYYIFIEEFLYKTRKAHISVIVMDESGSYESPRVVLDRPYHLSYPFVFEHGGDIYMIPESVSEKTVELYKCTDFPNEWEFQTNLMEGIKAVDVTVWFENDTWWMFANVLENDGASNWDELFLYCSDDLYSRNWKPHPLNPIVSDCRSARPAGKLFRYNGALYRPSQNCSVRYGYGFNICKIEDLDGEKYSESIVSRVEPNWENNLKGVHTFNHVKSLYVIDVLVRRRRKLLWP